MFIGKLANRIVVWNKSYQCQSNLGFLVTPSNCFKLLKEEKSKILHPLSVKQISV